MNKTDRDLWSAAGASRFEMNSAMEGMSPPGMFFGHGNNTLTKVRNIWQAVVKGDMDEFTRHLTKVCAAGTLSKPTIGGNRGTILHMTVAFTEKFGMFKALIDAGADPYVKNSDGDDVLAHARKIGRFGETAQEHAARVDRLAAYIAEGEAKLLAADLSTASAQARSATRL